MRSETRGAPICGLLLAAFIAACFGLGATELRAEPVPGKLVLFTAEEASELRLVEGEPMPGTLRAVSNGPRVVFDVPNVSAANSPPSMQMTTPGNLSLRFEENAAAVDMSTLEVSAKKSFFRKSLTGMLKPYVEGTVLKVQDVEVPEGSFLIEIMIADVDGAETIASYRLNVEGK